ncbi:MAG: SEC-C domain-containing protein, partial [Muribaculaceae bacterium]|nr:SEC-C domain-containing protein [Muribaculaceae bacterium]
ENAQKRVEENHFGVRKRLLEYDDVMNKQRTYIYSRRNHALLGERVGIDIANMLYDTIENIVNTYDSPNDYSELSLELFKVLTIETPFTEDEFRNMSKDDVLEKIHQAANESFQRRGQNIINVALPVINQWAETHELKGKIIVPITDGRRLFNLPVDIKDAYESGCKSIVKEWHKAILLVTIDELWKEHLRELDQLRQSVQNASYEQKDPLVIYKVESFHMFESMLNNLNVKVMSALMRGQIHVVQQRPAEDAANADQPQQPRQPQVREATPERPTDYSRYRTSKEENLPGEAAQRQAAGMPQGQRPRPEPIKAGPKIGRNDPCPCGSGKKYKACHGKGL